MNRFNTSCLLISALLVTVGCTQDTALEVATPKVYLMQLPEHQTSDMRSVPATVKAKQLTDISFRVSGELKSLPAQSGQLINKGDIIAVLDDTNYQLSMKESEARLALRKKQLERSRKMVQAGNLAKSTYDGLEAQYRIAKAQYDIALLNLNYTKLHAPFSGIISEVYVENFETLQTGSPVIAMHRVDKVDIEVDVPDFIVAGSPSRNTKDFEQLSINVNLDAYPGRNFSAYYHEHTTEHTGTEQTYKLILEMDSPDDLTILQGMSGNISLDMEKMHQQLSNSFLLPGEAIVVPDTIPVNAGQRIVWKMLENNTVQPVMVEVSKLRDNHYEVSGELRAGDRIILRGQTYLKPGMKVEVAEKLSEQSKEKAA